MNWSNVLYLVTNESRETENYYENIKKALAGGVDVLQLREKSLSSKKFLNRAKKLKSITDNQNTLFIINDRLDIALAVDADGLHLGQDDLPIDVCRKFLPNKVIGVSVSNKKEAIIAYEQGADYLGLGAIFPTASKDDYKLLSEEIANIVSSVPIPIIGIGGIKINHVRELKKKGLAGVAVISAILDKEDSYNSSKMFKKVLTKA